jgi:hypothetical protein
MKTVVNGVHIYFTAVESMHFDEDEKCIVLRTTSGAEHTIPCADKKSADKTIDTLETMMAFTSVL